MALAEHPRGSTTRTDKDGTYIAYHRVCNNCQVELTSRNRAATGSLKCKVCQGSDAYEVRKAKSLVDANYVPRPYQPQQRTEQGNVMRAAAVRTLEQSTDRALMKQLGTHHKVNPERQLVHSLLTKFLMAPTIKSLKDDLLAGLVDYEIKERFRFL